jgi:hypothetical protein
MAMAATSARLQELICSIEDALLALVAVAMPDEAAVGPLGVAPVAPTVPVAAPVAPPAALDPPAALEGATESAA